MHLVCLARHTAALMVTQAAQIMLHPVRCQPRPPRGLMLRVWLGSGHAHLFVVATEVTLSANTRMVCRAWNALARQSHTFTAWS